MVMIATERSNSSSREKVFNVKDYGASGLGHVTTTGSMARGGNKLIVLSSDSFAVGQGIAVYGAGNLGAGSKILVSKIIALNGNTITLRDNSERVVNSGLVEHSDHESIQRCIDEHLYPGDQESAPQFGRIIIPSGVYISHRPIHLGYGETFKSCQIVGDAPKFAGHAHFAGTSIWNKNGAEPALTINGARSTLVANLSLKGINRQWIEDNELGGLSGLAKDLEISDWIDPKLLKDFPYCNSRYAPYAGIAIDPYTGPRPAISYPNIAKPDFISKRAQYDSTAGSSNVKFENVHVEGFVVGVAIQPSKFDGNGEFIHLDNCILQNNVYGMSWGHQNARLLGLNNCIVAGCHTALATGVHGMQRGKPDVSAVNTAFERCIQWFDFPSLSWGGTPTFTHCRSELSYRLGTGTRNVISSPTPISFVGCEFGFGWAKHGMPSDVISNIGITSFHGCAFHPSISNEGNIFPNVVPFDVEDCYLRLQNCMFATGHSARTLFERHAVNATGGPVCKYLGIDVAGSWMSMARWDLDVGQRIADKVVWGEQSTSTNDRRVCIDVYSKSLRSGAVRTSDPGIPRTLRANPIAKQNLHYSADGKQLIVSDIPIQFVAQFSELGGDVGDLVYDDETKTHFVVAGLERNANGGTWKLFTATNFTTDGRIRTLPSNTGNFWVLLTRLYTPNYPVFGDFLEGSAEISNLHTKNNVPVTGLLPSFTAGDYFQPHLELNSMFSLGGTEIKSINNSTITMASNSQITQKSKRLELLIRKAPANEN